MERPSITQTIQEYSRHPLLPQALIFAAAILAYLNSFRAGFVWDDQYIIAGNALLRSWSSLPRLLCTGYLQGASGYGEPTQAYRPVLMLTYFLTYQYFGAAPWAYHSV